jgi:glycosyltransferase involved in cell wall biosynthesis
MNYVPRPPELRSALERRSAAAGLPSVGIVVPIYNEFAVLDALIADLLAQDYAGLREIWLVDGGSTDGTAERLSALRERDSRVHVSSNPRRVPAAALNLTIPNMGTDIVMRLDAHASYAPDVIRRSVEALLATGAAGVGAVARPVEGKTLLARGIVAAQRSPFGLGGAKFRKEGAAGWVDTVWNGCYWRHVIDRVGPLREDLVRAEDNDFNERVRRLGFGLYLSPTIHAFYQPRTTLGALWSQYLANGKGVAFAWFENRRAFGLRHLAPLALLSGLLVAFLVGLIWTPALAVFWVMLAFYVGMLLFAAALTLYSDRGWHALLMPCACATLHFAYGVGAFWGFVARLVRSARLGTSSRRQAAMTRLGLCLALACLLQCPTNAATPPRIWLAPSMERVARDAPAETADAIELYAGRREYQSFQVVIRAPDQDLAHVTVQVGDLVSDTGARLPAETTVFREHYVEVRRPSPDLRGSNRPLGRGWYPDILEPMAGSSSDRGAWVGRNYAEGFGVPAGQNQPIWIDIFVPPNAQPGRYHAELTVTSDRGAAKGAVALTVWDFELPKSPYLDSMFLVRNEHNVQAAMELLRNRLMPRGVGRRFEAGLVARFGLKSVNIGLWSDATNRQCTMLEAPSLERVREAVAGHDPALRLYNYTADEIDSCPNVYEKMRAWGGVLHRAGVSNLVTMSPIPELYDDGSGQQRSAVDVWVLLPKMYEAATSRVMDVLRKGDKVWSYNALVQDDHSPKWEIDFAPINFRIVPGFMSESLHLTGLLYWQVDLWTDDPWNDVQSFRAGGKDYPGEGMLIYPARDGGGSGVVPSMRLKWLRDGVQDYDYLQLLKRHGCADRVAATARTVAASWSDWTKDPAVLERARVRIGSLLDRAGKEGVVCRQ